MYFLGSIRFTFSHHVCDREEQDLRNGAIMTAIVEEGEGDATPGTGDLASQAFFRALLPDLHDMFNFPFSPISLGLCPCFSQDRGRRRLVFYAGARRGKWPGLRIHHWRGEESSKSMGDCSARCVAVMM